MAKKSKEKEAAAPAPAGTPRMLEHYVNVVRPLLAKALDRTNPHAIPKLEKIVVNMGVGVAVSEKKYARRPRRHPPCRRLRRSWRRREHRSHCPVRGSLRRSERHVYA